MALAQPMWRESLRDIEASLSPSARTLYAMGSASAVNRPTLAGANESPERRIWSVTRRPCWSGVCSSCT